MKYRIILNREIDGKTEIECNEYDEIDNGDSFVWYLIGKTKTDEDLEMYGAINIHCIDAIIPIDNEQ